MQIAVILVVFFECVCSYRMTKFLDIGTLGTVRKMIPDLCTCPIRLFVWMALCFLIPLILYLPTSCADVPRMQMPKRKILMKELCLVIR